MNVSYQEILGEYKLKHAELTYTTICQQLAIKKLEEKVRELEAQVEQANDNAEVERARANELQDLLDNEETTQGE
jgi:predicted GTPase